MSFKYKLLLSLLLLFYSSNHLCFASALETQLSSDQVMLGDSIFVTYISNNNTIKGSPDFSVLQQDFRIVTTNYSKAINVVNGAISMQTLWRLQLQPLHAGELIIPAINFGSDKSTAQKLQVTANPAMQTTQNNVPNVKQNLVVVRGEIGNTSPYVQSQVLYTFKLYFRAPLTDAHVEMPRIKDVTFFQLNDSPVQQVTLNGQAYNVIAKTFALFPEKPGMTVISPMQLNALVVDSKNSVFDDPFSFGKPKAISAATKEFNLTVRAVPANYQGTTWLPANNVALTEQWSNNTGRWESGTPVTRTIKIEAQGLRADQLPDLAIDKINGVSVYVDNAKRSNNVRNNTVLGVYEQKVTYIPNTTQAFTIPALKINWWNTQKDSNEIVQLDGRSIKVKPVAGVSNSPNGGLNLATSTATKSTSPTPNAETMVPKIQTTQTKTFYTSIWFWIACALSTAWVVTLWLLLRKKKSAVDKAVAPTQTPIELDEKSFAQACHAGQALLAQQYLLAWARTQWPNAPLNLASLREFIADQSFKLALQELERALYAKNAVSWHGASLLAAFQRLKKSGKHLDMENINADKHSKLPFDPLPPLNPPQIRNSR